MVSKTGAGRTTVPRRRSSASRGGAPCSAATRPIRIGDCDWSRRCRGCLRSASRDPETRERVELTLEQIGLPALAHRPAGTLSYGDVALLEIGMALISNPQLLLLDEPTCGMSPAETERAVEKIKQLARTIDIVIIEHDMSVVFEIAQDITVMTQGEILASGSPDEISSDERVREPYLGRPEDEDYVEEAINA